MATDYANFFGKAADAADRAARKEKQARKGEALQRLEQVVVEAWAISFAAQLVLEFRQRRLAFARAVSDHGIVMNHQPFDMEWLRDIPKEIRDVGLFLELVNDHLTANGTMFALIEYHSGIYDAATKANRKQARLSHFE